MNSRFPKAEIGGTGTLVSGSVLVVLTVLIVFVLSSQVAAFSFAVFGDNQGRTETYKLLINEKPIEMQVISSESGWNATGVKEREHASRARQIPIRSSSSLVSILRASSTSAARKKPAARRLQR